jgi:hypothetical protein
VSLGAGTATSIAFRIVFYKYSFAAGFWLWDHSGLLARMRMASHLAAFLFVCPLAGSLGWQCCTQLSLPN